MTRKVLPPLTVALAISPLLLVGCDTAPPGVDMTGPVLNNVSLVGNPNPAVPLAAILRVTTDEPTELTLNINDGEWNWSVTPSDEMTTQHEVPVLGMRPGRTHTITASLRDSAGNETLSEGLTFETPALPDAFPTPRVTV
ncbi:MAG: aryl-sulfate sulfotransferase N-terminal domain-containing protein, partial [Gammaproteobacteria bacterium]